MQKSELRTLVKNEKKKLRNVDKVQSADLVFSAIEKLPQFMHAQNVLCYWSLPDELDTTAFIEKWKDEKQIYLPVVKGKEVDLIHFRGKEQMKIGAFGIKEPIGEPLINVDKIDFGIIPGVAFSADGYRLGRGGGYYDRILPKLSKAYTLGVGYALQLFKEVPIEPHDIKLEAVICK